MLDDMFFCVGLAIVESESFWRKFVAAKRNR